MISARAASGIGKALLPAGALCWSGFNAAQVPVPPLTGHVTDQTGADRQSSTATWSRQSFLTP